MQKGSNFSFSFYNTQKAHPYVILRLLSYYASKFVHGSLLYVGLRKNKEINKSHKKLYFTRLPRSPPRMDFYQIWNKRSSRRRNESWNIVCQSVQGFQFYSETKSPFTHRKLTSPLWQFCATVQPVIPCSQTVPSMPWHCWLDDRKSIWSTKHPFQQCGTQPNLEWSLEK